MSISALCWAFNLQIKPATAKLTLIALADNANDTGCAWPSLETITRKTSLDRKTVVKSLDRLEKLGILLDTGERKGTTRQVKVYRLNGWDESYPERTVPKTEPFRSCRETVPFFPGNSTENGTENRKEPKEEPTTAARTADTYPEAFEELWKAYPKRDGDNPKRRAFKAYRARIKEGITPETMLAGAQRYAAWVRARNKEGTEVVKQAATFLGPDKCFLAEWTVEKKSTDRMYDRFPVV